MTVEQWVHFLSAEIALIESEIMYHKSKLSALQGELEGAKVLLKFKRAAAPSQTVSAPVSPAKPSAAAPFAP